MFNPLTLGPSLNFLPQQFIFLIDLIKNEMTETERAARLEFHEANFEGRRIKWINQLHPVLEDRINVHSLQTDYVDGICITDENVILTAARVSQSYSICLNAFTETNQLILRAIGQSCFLDPIDLLQDMQMRMQREDPRIHHYGVYILGGVLGLMDDESQTLWEDKDELAIEECMLNLNGRLTEEDTSNFDVIFTGEEILFGTHLIEIQNDQLEEPAVDLAEEEFSNDSGSNSSDFSADSTSSETI